MAQYKGLPFRWKSPRRKMPTKGKESEQAKKEHRKRIKAKWSYIKTIRAKDRRRPYRTVTRPIEGIIWID